MQQIALLHDFSRIFKILPAQLRRKVYTAFGLITFQALLEVATILSMSFLAMVIIYPDRLAVHPIMLKVYELIPYLEKLQSDARYFAAFAASSVTLVIVLKNLMTARCSYYTSQLGSLVSLYAGEVIFSNFLYSPYIEHLGGDSSKVFMGLSWRGQLGQAMILYMNFYSYLVVSLSLISTLIFFVPASVLVVLLVIGAASVAIYRGIRNPIDSKGKESSEWSRQETKATMNAMNGIRETLIYRQQSSFFQHFKEACLGGIKPRIYLSLVPSFPSWILESLGFLAIPASMMAMLIISDATMSQMTVTLTMIMLISWRILPLLNRSMGSLVQVRSVRHAAMDCLELVEKAQGTDLKQAVTPDENFSFQQSIAFKNLEFCYPKAEKNCLENISFDIQRGQRVGIIGKSGAGKSSIAVILSGLVQPTDGQMLVDGKELSPEEQAAYCERIGYVPQSPYILAGTLAENVAFSEWGKPWDEKRVLHVCKMAELEIAQSRGIDTDLGQGGAGLSGGQAQRLSIARALYANPCILIFDEATSALDTGIETAIMNTIYSLPESMTTIIIAHRLSTVKNCDKLIWVDQGTVKMMGTPSEVLPHYEEFLTSAHKKS